MRKATVVGAISAHGCRAEDDTYVVIPKGLPFLLPLAKEGDNLQWQKQFGSLDLSVIRENEGRCISTSLFDETPYKSGHVLKNVTLCFNVVFKHPNDPTGKSDNCFTTGIITSRSLHGEIMECSSIDGSLRDELMKNHEDKIIPRNRLWDQRVQLGNVLKMITDAGTYDGMLGIFCRGESSHRKETLPSFLTVKMSDEIFHSCFFSKMDVLERCAQTKTFDGYNLIGLEESKLKLRVTFAEICSFARKKLAINNTINSFEFHSVIEIYHTQSVPLECVVFAMELKFSKLIDALIPITDSDLVIDPTVTSPEGTRFLRGMRFLCQQFKTELRKYILCYKQAFDVVIFVAEKIVDKEVVSKGMYGNIMGYLDKFEFKL
jgi:hypothetical protein